jgi:hypothetical protein
MPTQDDVRRIALSLPGTIEDPNAFKFRVDGKLFVWAWLERVDPRRARVPSSDVIAVRVADDEEKQALLALDQAVFFTEPHYDGYNAVLVRLAAIDPELLTAVITAAWRCRASRELSGRGERI